MMIHTPHTQTHESRGHTVSQVLELECCVKQPWRDRRDLVVAQDPEKHMIRCTCDVNMYHETGHLITSTDDLY